ncbi:MAG: hypothetical protein A2X49_13305 [Lentisphaerae bacterium GWF2_52_8]|nr:MAG: hypothetical protein A2X49_13305 [Lentisphaerae bacterium GWF2_52_8]
MPMQHYLLIDSGHRRKLEQIGHIRLVRPAPNAFWPPLCDASEWDTADGSFERNSSGGGTWTWKGGRAPEPWTISHGGLSLLIRPTNFGHLGFFAEQSANWDWLRSLAPALPQPARTLNLFAYSGGASLAMAQAGAQVCHLDAAKGMIEWGKENLALNPKIPETIRWIADDVFKFVGRELKRGASYHGIVLDPPSFGRGAQGQVWKLEDGLLDLLSDCRKLLVADAPHFVLLSCHSPGFSPLSLARMLEAVFPGSRGLAESGEMSVAESSGRVLPAGIYARFLSK